MTFNFQSDNLVSYEELDSLAAMISPDFSMQNLHSPQSIGSTTRSYGSDSSEYYSQLQGTVEPSSMTPYQRHHTSSYSSSSPTGSYYSPPPANCYTPQYFFPPNFPEMPLGYQSHGEVWNNGLQDYIQSGYDQTQQTQFVLSSVGKAKSGLKNRRRASRSKCPCVKCGHARANAIPSPASHGCMVQGCIKSYTRPAHLRAHLKTHENDTSPKCVICSKTVMSADLFITHMIEHGREMKV